MKFDEKMKGKLYPIAVVTAYPDLVETRAILESKFKKVKHSNLRVRLTGEFRCPREGKWYVSGAIPEGYVAPNDLSTEFWIGELVEVRVETKEVVVE